MTAAQVIDAYVRQVTAGLPGPARDRGDMTAELRTGLCDAVDAHCGAGLTEDDAVAAATAEFGDPRAIAAAFRSELAVRLARRFALTLAGTGPVVGLLWTAAAMASHVGISHARPAGWSAVGPVLALALLVTIAGALATIAASGTMAGLRASRWRAAPATAAASGFGAMTVDLAVLALLATQLATAPGKLAAAPVAAAAVASLVRLLLACQAARRCLAARPALA